jgi:hypothetical protein
MTDPENIVLAFYGAPQYSVRLNPGAADGRHFELVKTSAKTEGEDPDVQLIEAFSNLEEAEDAASKEAAKARTLSVLSLFTKSS